MASLLNIAEADLKLVPYFGGDRVTAADIAMIYPMAAAKDRFYLGCGLSRMQRLAGQGSAVRGLQISGSKRRRDSIILRV